VEQTRTFFQKARAAAKPREPMSRFMPDRAAMTSTTFAPSHPVRPASAAARAVFHLLEKLRHGSLELRLPDGSMTRLGSRAEGEPRAAMRLANWSVCGATLKSGDIGFAETFVAGDWILAES